MQITYNLKYKKVNYLGKPVLEKEGEILLDSDGFTLKGKGGGDKGEKIRLVDVRDIFVKNEVVTFTTIAKEKYYLNHFKGLVNDFVRDFMKIRNQFLLEALFLEQGEMKSEFDAHFLYESKYGKAICKGEGKIRLYERSIVVIPRIREAFAIPFDFLANQDIDEINYEISLTLDNGKKITIDHLGTMYEDFIDALDKLREVMYQNIVNGLRSELPEFGTDVVIKMASLMRGGKATPITKIKKIDEELWEKFYEVLLPTEEAKAAYEMLAELTTDENIYAGFRDKPEGSYYAWTLTAVPEKNVIAIQVTSNQQINTHFFQIIMEHGDPKEKATERIQEIDQTMLNFKFDTNVFSRDRRDLKKSKYRLALSKIPYLRSLRKSYIGRAYFKSQEDWKKYLGMMLEKADLSKPAKRKKSGFQKRLPNK